jgi:hypothetical protein
MMRVPERPEILSATVAFAGCGDDGRGAVFGQGKKNREKRTGKPAGMVRKSLPLRTRRYKEKEEGNNA